MKYQKMLNKLKDILSAKRKAQLKKYASLKKVLRSLHEEKKKIEVALAEDIDGDTRHEMTSKLKVITKQRKKGLTVLKELKEERDAADS